MYGNVLEIVSLAKSYSEKLKTMRSKQFERSLESKILRYELYN